MLKHPRSKRSTRKSRNSLPSCVAPQAGPEDLSRGDRTRQCSARSALRRSGVNNPFHRSRAQVKDGVLCRDAADPDHFYLIGEWADIEEHRRIREFVAREIKPEFVQLIEGGHFMPTYRRSCR